MCKSSKEICETQQSIQILDQYGKISRHSHVGLTFTDNVSLKPLEVKTPNRYLVNVRTKCYWSVFWSERARLMQVLNSADWSSSGRGSGPYVSILIFSTGKKLANSAFVQSYQVPYLLAHLNTANVRRIGSTPAFPIHPTQNFRQNYGLVITQH